MGQPMVEVQGSRGNSLRRSSQRMWKNSKKGGLPATRPPCFLGGAVYYAKWSKARTERGQRIVQKEGH